MPADALKHPDNRFSYRAEIKRKALHLLALVVPLGMAWLGNPASWMLLWVGAALALSGDILRARSPAFSHLITTGLGSLMRPDEQPIVPGPVVINGATWVLVSAFLLAVLFPLALAVPAFTAFMIADAAAALVGRRFGLNRWPGTRRTVEGSAAFALSALGVLLLFPAIGLVPALCCAVASAGAEALPGPFNDNLRVPLVGAFVLLLFTL